MLSPSPSCFRGSQTILRLGMGTCLECWFFGVEGSFFDQFVLLLSSRETVVFCNDFASL